MTAPSFTSLVDVYEDACTRFAHRDALGTKRDGEWTWASYAHLRALVDECRGGLAQLGVAPGDRVAIVAANRLEWAVACYATYGLEAVFVPMYEAQLRKEWTHILKDSGARVCIASTPSIHETVRAIASELPGLEHVIGLELPAEHEQSFRHLLGAGADHPIEPRHPTAEAIAGFIYTSGTTGMPKGVVLSHGNLVSNLMAMREVFPLEPTDRSLAFLPWAHSFGQVAELHYGLSQGISIALNDELPHLLDNLAEVHPTILVAVPRVFNKIYDSVSQQIAHKPAVIRKLFADGLKTAALHRDGKKGSWLRELELSLDDKLIFSKVREKFGGKLKFVISASAALSKEVAEFVDALGIDVYEGYGLTETSPAVTINTPGHRKIGSVGRVIPGVRVEIDRDVTGDPIDGEIVVYGPNVMQGYHERPEETRAALTPDGGLRTGDLGHLDEDGYLYITGRIKEQYKLENGKYVMPAPVEEHLKLSPYIANVMLHGANRPYNVAVVVPEKKMLEEWAANEKIDLAGAGAKARMQSLLHSEIETRGAELRRYELPKRFVIADEDFTTDNGLLTPTLKLKRRAVLDRYGADLEALYRGGDAVEAAIDSEEQALLTKG